jgi:hypothetical protein
MKPNATTVKDLSFQYLWGEFYTNDAGIEAGTRVEVVQQEDECSYLVKFKLNELIEDELEATILIEDLTIDKNVRF